MAASGRHRNAKPAVGVQQLTLADWERDRAQDSHAPTEAPIHVPASAAPLDDIAPLAAALAPRIAAELATRARGVAVDESPTARLLTLDQLVAELPPGKRPETWKRLALRAHPPRRDPRLRQARRHALLPARVRARLAAAPARRPPSIGGTEWHAARSSSGGAATTRSSTTSTASRSGRRSARAGARPSARSPHANARSTLGTWREPSSETLAALRRALARHAGSCPRSWWRPIEALARRRSSCVPLRTSASTSLPRLGERALASLRTEDVDSADRGCSRPRAARPERSATSSRPLREAARRRGADRARSLANPAARADLPPAQDFAGRELPVASTRRRYGHALLELAPSRSTAKRGRTCSYVGLFDVALGTGLRLGELRALRWTRRRPRAAVDPRRARLLPTGARGARRPTQAFAAVPLFASVDAAVRELAARAVERGRYAPDELIFGSMRGAPLQPSNFRQRVWGPALRRAGLDRVGLPLPRSAAHLRFASCRRRRRCQARPGGRRSREPADNAQALLAPTRLAGHRRRGPTSIRLGSD